MMYQRKVVEDVFECGLFLSKLSTYDVFDDIFGDIEYITACYNYYDSVIVI